MTTSERATKAPTFRKKPVVVEAMQWSGKNSPQGPSEDDDVIEWMMQEPSTVIDAERKEDGWHLFITVLGVRWEVTTGDWILKDAQGEFVPCESDIFEAEYERVASSTPTITRETLDRLIASEFHQYGPEGSAGRHNVEEIARQGALRLSDALLAELGENDG